MKSSKVYNSSTYPLNSFVYSNKNKNLGEKLQNLVPVFADYSNVNLTILPNNFEPHNNEWKDWLVHPKNQGNCGSCWSFSSVGLLTDRINILSREKLIDSSLSDLINIVCNDLNTILIEDDPNELDTLNDPYKNQNFEGCYGNSIILSMYYLKIYGTCKYECFPYHVKNLGVYKYNKTNFGIIPNRLFRKSPTDFKNLSNESNKVASCFFLNPFSVKPYQYCADQINAQENQNYSTPFQTFQILFPYFIKDGLHNNEYIKYDIYRWGPVCSSFFVYQDFYSFDPVHDGVYIHDNKDDIIIGGHSIEIVGWGEWKNKEGTLIPFWWIKNSWGKNYGYNGYFRFLRGKNQCEIETNIISALPYMFYDIQDMDKYQYYNKQLISLGIFNVDGNKLNYTINFISKIIPLDLPRKYIQDILRNCIKMYGFFYYNALINTSLFDTDFYINGYSFEQYKNLPGLDYTFTKKNGKPVLFPIDKNFLAGYFPSNDGQNQNCRHVGIASLVFIISFIVLLLVIFFITLYKNRKTNHS